MTRDQYQPPTREFMREGSRRLQPSCQGQAANHLVTSCPHSSPLGHSRTSQASRRPSSTRFRIHVGKASSSRPAGPRSWLHRAGRREDDLISISFYVWEYITRCLFPPWRAWARDYLFHLLQTLLSLFPAMLSTFLFFGALLLSTGVAIAVPKRALPSGYAPRKATCPASPLVRPATSLSSQETAYIAQRTGSAQKSLAAWLHKTNSAFATSSLPTVALTTSGGGYRSLLSGAGVIQGLDVRDSSVGTSGLFQGLTYQAGLSGSFRCLLVDSLIPQVRSGRPVCAVTTRRGVIM